jgi:hypothetical protein
VTAANRIVSPGNGRGNLIRELDDICVKHTICTRLASRDRLDLRINPFD